MKSINVHDLEVAQAKIVVLGEKPNNQKFHFPDRYFIDVINKFISQGSTAKTLDVLYSNEQKQFLTEMAETSMSEDYREIILKVANENDQFLSGLLPVIVRDDGKNIGLSDDVLNKLGPVKFGVMKSQLQISESDAFPTAPVLYAAREVDYPVYWDSMYDFSTSHLRANTATDSQFTANDAYDSAIINVSAELESSYGNAVIQLENYEGNLLLSEYVNVTEKQIKNSSFVSFR